MIQFVKTTRVNLQDQNLPRKTYAVAQSRAIMDIETLAEHIASHGNTYDAGDVMAISKKIVSCVRELLLDGYTIRLGDLGTFFVKLKSNGVCESIVDDETGQKRVFTAQNINEVKVCWKKSDKFTNLIQDAKFTEVETRAVRTANLKEKQEQLAAGTYDPNGNDGDDENGTERE